MTDANKDFAYEADGKLVAPAAFYALACDPRRSVAVEACAGAGKTWMLVARVLRALAAQAASPGGVQPQEILAITFTKKATGEMRARLQEWLAAFANVAPGQLHGALQQHGLDAAFAAGLPSGLPSGSGAAVLSGQGDFPDANNSNALVNLYQKILSSGRQVQIRTFHSWFASLLRNAPLAVLQQLALPPGYELLEDDSRAVELVWPRFYAALHADTALLTDYQTLVAEHGRSQAQKALEALLAKRTEFLLADEQGVVQASVRRFSEVFADYANFETPEQVWTTSAINRQALLGAAKVLARASAPTFAEKGVALEKAASAQDWDGVVDALLTQKGDPRKFGEKLVGIDQVRQTQALVQAFVRARSQHAAWLYQQGLGRLARVLIKAFATVKRERGWIDMPDLERAALVLLADPQLGAWMQQRLDATVGHLLIDEFQDTNPLQWQALSAWLHSYAGAGGGVRPGVFIVGDPKQSIYRFRRAEPQVFRAAQAFVGGALEGVRLACDHTRRNAPEVLAAVNAVMAQAQMDGLADFRTHTTESTSAGAVLRLPQIPRPDKDAKPTPVDGVWRDSLTTPRELAEDTLRTLEARQGAAWIAMQIANGAQPKDFMVLSRKRASLGPMQDALRALQIPATVAEKIGLMDCCEVQDVVALLDVLVSPRHSLSLARALKSPLFGLDDDGLVAIALLAREHKAQMPPNSGEDSEGPGWLYLLSKADQQAPQVPGLQGLYATLMQYQHWVQTLPPHDALSAIYHHGDVVRKFAVAAPATLRHSVVANLGAVLQATLALEGARYTTTYSFVRAMKSGQIKAPVQTPTQAVQLLTVHGAKGLEAPTVLLLDTDAQPSRAESMGILVDWPGEQAHPRKFAFVASESHPPTCLADTLAAEQQARAREEINGLYVAMTRARERLVVSSSAPHAANPGSWWARLLPFAQPLMGLFTDALGGEILIKSEENNFELNTLIVPSIIRHSNATNVIKNNNDIIIKNKFENDYTQVGRAMHRLLEWQPLHRGSAQFAVTEAQVAAVVREFQLNEEQAVRAQAMGRGIREGEGQWAWRADLLGWCGNEVELAHQGQILRLDRLVQRSDTAQWWVLDYKSSAQPLAVADLVLQLTQYRDAVAASYPVQPVQAAFLTPDGKVHALPFATKIN